jgi:RNA polymerase sigma-70 factor (ECF subfamily)
MPDPTESCSEILALLSDYLDFELPPDACKQIEQHLAGCSPCEEFAESLRKTVALCRTFEPRAMPGPLTAEAKAQLEDAWKKMLSARDVTKADANSSNT